MDMLTFHHQTTKHGRRESWKSAPSYCLLQTSHVMLHWPKKFRVEGKIIFSSSSNKGIDTYKQSTKITYINVQLILFTYKHTRKHTYTKTQTHTYTHTDTHSHSEITKHKNHINLRYLFTFIYVSKPSKQGAWLNKILRHTITSQLINTLDFKHTHFWSFYIWLLEWLILLF